MGMKRAPPPPAGTAPVPCVRSVWDVQSGKCTATLTGHTDGVTSVAVAPDGRTAVSGSYDKTVRWVRRATRGGGGAGNRAASTGVCVVCVCVWGGGGD